MVRYQSNPQRGEKSSNRRAELESELIGNVAEKIEDLGSYNGSVQKETPKGEVGARKRGARLLSIQQGKRQRQKTDFLNWYAASYYRPKNVQSYWQKALDAEHDRYNIPDSYADYSTDTGVTNQYGLVETAQRNYMKSRARLSGLLQVGV